MTAVSTYANDTRLVITQKDGSETVFLLSSHPVITFSGKDMVITSNNTTITIPMASVVNYATNEDPASISPLSADLPEYRNGSIVFSGLVRGAEVRVYRVDGSLVSSQQADSSGHATVSIATLPKGVYIVRTPNSSMKISNGFVKP